jgi:phosphoribosylformylglycinamidine cyclo-ligase
MNEAYKSAGVDIHAGYRAVELIKPHIAKTKRDGVLGGFGGFGGLFSLAKVKDMDEPIMVSGTDSVGTKIMLAFLTDRHDTVGIDCVAMCVNDIVCCGAEPLYFLDYIGCGKNIPEKTALVVKGVADGCVMANCALIGGEMAEMSGVYAEDDYDLVGFASGVVDRKNIIDGQKVKAGDVIIGIKSSGLHSNGFSLVRKVLNPTRDNVNRYVDELGATLGDALIVPTKIYVKPILELIKRIEVKGISNITGGGLIENVPRSLPSGKRAVIDTRAWDIPAVFSYIKNIGGIDRNDMFNTFNMGIGMTVTVSELDADAAVEILKNSGEDALVIGSVEDTKDGSGICLK